MLYFCLMIYIGDRNLAVFMLCNITPSVGLLYITTQIYFKQTGRICPKYVLGLVMLCYLNTNLNYKKN